MKQAMSDARYDSIVDFLDALGSGARNPANEQTWKTWANGDPGNGAGWYGAECKTGADVQQKMRDGWNKGRERMQELRDKIGELNLAPVDRRRRIVRGDAGDHLDMAYVYAGRMDVAWSTPKRRTTLGPQKIELMANMLCSGGDHADVLFWRGAAAAVLADVLETAGYMVRLVVAFGGTTGSGEKVSCRITVKEHGCPLDIASTSAVIMPGFFRALGHAWIMGHNKGKISSPSISVQQGKLDDGELLLSHNVRDHGTALAFINNTIAALNEGRLGEAA